VSRTSNLVPSPWCLHGEVTDLEPALLRGRAEVALTAGERLGLEAADRVGGRPALDMPVHPRVDAAARLAVLEHPLDVERARDGAPPGDDDGMVGPRRHEDVARLEHEPEILPRGHAADRRGERLLHLVGPAVETGAEEFFPRVAERHVLAVT
jgi:hypothetical protein